VNHPIKGYAIMPDSNSNPRAHFNLLFLCILFLFWGCAQKLVPRSSGSLEPSIPHQSTETQTQAPYDVYGQTYYPLSDAHGYSQKGIASWYGEKFHGRQTSNQEVYNMYDLTAAHKTLPFNTKVKVTHQDTGKNVVVRINDRGPFVDDRIIDLSYAAAQELNIDTTGTAPVLIEALESESAELEPSKVEVIKAQTVSLEPPPARSESFSVQLGLFINREYAEQLSQSHQGRVQTVQIGNENYFRVLVGDYPQYEDAVMDREKLRRQGREDAFIIKIQGPGTVVPRSGISSINP